MSVFILIYSCFLFFWFFFKKKQTTLAEGNKVLFCSWESWTFFGMCNFGVKRLGDFCGIYGSTHSLIVLAVSAFVF